MIVKLLVWRLSWKKHFFQGNITIILNQLKKEYGPIPGLFTPSMNSYIFESFFLPKMKKMSDTTYISTDKTKSNLEKCLSLVTCRSAMVKGIQFCVILKKNYPKQSFSMKYLGERPDFHLGRFLSIFADRMFLSKKSYDIG